MTGNRPVEKEFIEGDEVVLARGSYQGTLGVFVKFREDAHWADVMERSGQMRSHPVEWLAHSTDATPGFATPRAQ